MEPEPKLFGLAVENIPIVNIQEEFETHKALLADDEFRKKLLNMRDPVETPFLIWKGLPKNLLTYFLQRATLGVEACVSAAAKWEATARGLLTDELAQKMEDPFRLHGQGTADVFYNRLPGVLDQEYALERCDPRLWATTQQFYREIRNPLFHGYQLCRPEAEQVSEAVALLDSIQAWIDLVSLAPRIQLIPLVTRAASAPAPAPPSHTADRRSPAR